MDGLSPWHLMVIVVVALLVFGGRGKLSGLMGDAGGGIKTFRDELKDSKPSAAAAQPAQIPARSDSDGDCGVITLASRPVRYRRASRPLAALLAAASDCGTARLKHDGIGQESALIS